MKEALKPGLNKLAAVIFYVRGEKVMLDFHLASLYEIETRIIKQQVWRNIDRFPDDFLIILTDPEWQELITNCDNLGALKFSPSLPFAFTEQGVAMLSSVLRSRKAIEVNIAIMRTFVQIRRMMSENIELKRQIEFLEKKYDEQFPFGNQMPDCINNLIIISHLKSFTINFSKLPYETIAQLHYYNIFIVRLFA